MRSVLIHRPSAARNAKRLYDVEVITGSLNDVAGSSDSYDLLVLSGVLEHIREVKPALQIMRQMLSDSGMLFIAVPDATGFANCDDAPFQQFSTEHINFFSPVSLANVLGAGGFRPVLSQQRSYEWEFGAQMPSVDAIFAKGNSPAVPMTPDTTTEPASRNTFGNPSESTFGFVGPWTRSSPRDILLSFGALEHTHCDCFPRAVSARRRSAPLLTRIRAITENG